MPRASIVYDVFGTGRTAIKVAYGRYSYNAGTMTNANSMMAGLREPDGQDRPNGTGGTARCRSCPNPANLLSTTGGPNRSLDPNLELPYTDEFVVGLDQQVMRDTTVRFNYVRKLERNRMKLQNTAIPFRGLQHPGRLHRSRPRLRLRRRRPRSSRSTAWTELTSAGAPIS